MTTEPTTEAEIEAEGIEIPELEIPFHGRQIWVRMPSPEQLLVWDRVIKRLTDAPPNTSWTGSEIMAALDRLRRIIDSLMVNKADVVWLDDQFLDGVLTFKQLAPFITQVVDAFAAAAEENAPNRAAKRAAKKTKKAVRKKES
jgi:hypothetical protein